MKKFLWIATIVGSTISLLIVFILIYRGGQLSLIDIVLITSIYLGLTIVPYIIARSAAELTKSFKEEDERAL